MFSGGMRLDLPFTPQLLYELAKMDGAIIVDTELKTLANANVQLMPDPAIPSVETGTRHRTAERVAKQTGALVISISQQRETVTLFMGERRLPARHDRRRARQDEPGRGDGRDVPAAARAGADAAHRARVPERGHARRRPRRPAASGADHADGSVVERDCIELGSEGRLIRMRLDELMVDVPREKTAVIFDYQAANGERSAGDVLERLGAAVVPGAPRVGGAGGAARLSAQRQSTRLRRHSAGATRALADPAAARDVVRRVVADLEGLDAILRASSASSRRSRASGRRGRARSARGCAGCRSTISSTVTSSCRRRFPGISSKIPGKMAFSSGFSYTGSVPPAVSQVAGVFGEYGRKGGSLVQGRRQGRVPPPRCWNRGQEGKREVLGQQREYLTIKILHNDMTVNVPCENVEKVGLRKVIDEAMVEQVSRHLPATAQSCPRTGTGGSSTTATR